MLIEVLVTEHFLLIYLTYPWILGTKHEKFLWLHKCSIFLSCKHVRMTWDVEGCWRCWRKWWKEKFFTSTRNFFFLSLLTSLLHPCSVCGYRIKNFTGDRDEKLVSWMPFNFTFYSHNIYSRISSHKLIFKVLYIFTSCR